MGRTIKIAYLANIRFPSERAHAVQISHMCNAFVSNGTELDLYVNKRVSHTGEEIEKYFGIETSYTIKRIQHGFFMANSKIAFYLSELIFTLSFLFFSNSRGYDIFYSRSEWVLFFCSFILPRKKLVWESHEAKFTFPARSILQKGIKTVVISEGIRDEYRSKNVAHEQMFVAHDAIDESFFEITSTKESAREKLGLSIQDKIVMYIGGFDTWKGADVFFETSNSLESVTCVAIGGKPEELRRLKNKYPNIIFLGPRPYWQLKDLQQAADILVVPNTAKNKLSAEYTSPLKLFSHMASGVPLLVSDIPSIRNIVNDKQVSFFEPDSTVSLSNKVDSILSEYSSCKDKARSLSLSAENFTWTKRAKNILSFIG